MKLRIWLRKPRNNYRITGETVVLIFKELLIEPASLFSLTPSLNLVFFWIGNDYDKKLINYSGAVPVIVVFIAFSASLDDSKG